MVVISDFDFIFQNIQVSFLQNQDNISLNCPTVVKSEYINDVNVLLCSDRSIFENFYPVVLNDNALKVYTVQ